MGYSYQYIQLIKLKYLNLVALVWVLYFYAKRPVQNAITISHTKPPNLKIVRTKGLLFKNFTQHHPTFAATSFPKVLNSYIPICTAYANRTVGFHGG